ERVPDRGPEGARLSPGGGGGCRLREDVDGVRADRGDHRGLEAHATVGVAADRRQGGPRHQDARRAGRGATDRRDPRRGDPDRGVELVVIGLPNHLHLPAVRVAAEARKAIVCTKPLARNGQEAAEMVKLVREAGVMHGYAETEVFSPDVMRARQMIESGAIGKVLTVRAREAHSGPHAPHFWDAETAGGGALLDMGCHTVEAARYFFGKENRIKDVFAWGATMVHKERTTGEDNAVLLLRLEDGRTSLTEASWTAKGGMELRNEVYGTMGRIVTDTSSTRIRAFIQQPAGYLMEKA